MTNGAYNPAESAFNIDIGNIVHLPPEPPVNAGRIIRYMNHQGDTIEGNMRIRISDIAFLEISTRRGLVVPAIMLPQVYSCPSDLLCVPTCETGERIKTICDPVYYNRALHNMRIMTGEVSGGGNVSASTQIATIAKKYDFFLWNFTGEILSDNYFYSMIRAASLCKKTVFICRTRVLRYAQTRVQKDYKMPRNLRIVPVSPHLPANQDIFADAEFIR